MTDIIPSHMLRQAGRRALKNPVYIHGKRARRVPAISIIRCQISPVLTKAEDPLLVLTCDADYISGPAWHLMIFPAAFFDVKSLAINIPLEDGGGHLLRPGPETLEIAKAFMPLFGDLGEGPLDIYQHTAHPIINAWRALTRNELRRLPL